MTDDAHKLGAVETLRATLARGFDFQYAYEEVMSQARALKLSGRTPLRIRISPHQWSQLRACPETGMGSTFHFDRNAQPMFCGLPFRVDGKFDAPLTVECAGDGSELS